MDWDDDDDFFTEERDQEYWRREELKLSRQLDLASTKEESSSSKNASVLPNHANAVPVPARTKQFPGTKSVMHRPDTCSKEHRVVGAKEAKQRNDSNEQAYYTVFVGNIPLSFYEIHLEELFESYGRIYHVYIQRHSAKGADTTYGFVRFEREHEAERAIKALDRKRIEGKRLHVSWSQKPQEKEKVDQYVQKRNVRLQEVSDLRLEDDHKLWCLIETYTMLLAQKSAHAPGNVALPELGEFLNTVNRGSCSLVPAHTMHDHQISMNLDDLQDSFIESFSDNFADESGNMGLLSGENEDQQNLTTPLDERETHPSSHQQQNTKECDPQTNLAYDGSGAVVDEGKSTTSPNSRLSVKEIVQQTTAPYVISYGRGRKILSLTD